MWGLEAWLYVGAALKDEVVDTWRFVNRVEEDAVLDGVANGALQCMAVAGME